MIRLVAMLALFVTPALAQQQPPDPATLQRAIAAIQQQRNAALDQAASMQIEAQRLADENAKLKARVDELEKPKAEQPQK